ncbi:hydrophobic surface binding protein A family protein [Metarhizium robertsii]|uniref:Heterokaryon incompatibility n=2 Tax=Metarhizium robertsii TaxID=568076 RepID=E9F909_METRA|nr:Heterokaryon incompatibility [Metarhizium robertsii ARSEF 23]EFY95777.2 Heterokaryon incompatibility [Metarhizium robertsii ARSEF 23]EXU96919.1 hydrophobic surface binding protein A family protein [Metarhizium robertsii]
MKFLLFASTALALARRQGDVLSADVAAIVTSVTALQTRVNEFQGAAQADALIAASNGVVAAIKKGTADARASPSLSQDEAFGLVPPLQNLIGVVNKTVGDLVAKKRVFADSGRGCEVYPQLVEQRVDSQAFSDALVAKVPDALKGIAGQISAPILKSLADGAAAFKDVVCAATSTSATQSATISVSSTASSAGSVTTTGGGTSVSSPASTSGAQTGSASGTATEPGSATGTKTSGTATGTTATGSKTRTGFGTATATASESCGETTTVQVPVTETIPCTTTGGSGSHPTGGPGSQPSSGSGPQPTGGSGCPGCAPGQTSPGSGSGPHPTSTLVPIPSGGEGGHGGSGGNGGSGGSGGSGAHPSPSSPVIVAGAPRGEIPLAVHVAMAAIVGAVGAAL